MTTPTFATPPRTLPPRPPARVLRIVPETVFLHEDAFGFSYMKPSLQYRVTYTYGSAPSTDLVLTYDPKKGTKAQIDAAVRADIARREAAFPEHDPVLMLKVPFEVGMEGL